MTTLKLSPKTCLHYFVWTVSAIVLHAFSLVGQDMVGKSIVAIFHALSLLLQLEKERGIIKSKNFIQGFVGSVFFWSPLYLGFELLKEQTFAKSFVSERANFFDFGFNHCRLLQQWFTTRFYSTVRKTICLTWQLLLAKVGLHIVA